MQQEIKFVITEIDMCGEQEEPPLMYIPSGLLHTHMGVNETRWLL